MKNKIKKLVTNKRKNKKALSEMVSYILLVVIALGLSVGIYAWLREQLPSENEEKCSEDVALTIVSYTCDINTNQIALTIKNTGLFNISGIYARGSNEIGKITTIMLDSTTILGQGSPASQEGSDPYTKGKYDFNPTAQLKLAETKQIIFSYNFDDTDKDELIKIQIQPFVKGKTNILLCDNVVDLDLTGCT
jgi:hypothetical protein